MTVHNNPLKTVTPPLSLMIRPTHHGVKNWAINDITLDFQNYELLSIFEGYDFSILSQ
jgi:hypothetical protein